MMNTKRLIGLAALAAIGAWPALAQTATDTAAVVTDAAAAAPAVVVKVAPPSGVWETAPPPAEGYVWSAGYFQWKGDRYAWTAGEWLPLRAGFDYRQRHWVQRDDGLWTLMGGDWVRKTEQVARHK